MIRKLLMTAAIAAIAFGTLSPGTAEARPWGYHGGWGYAHYWGPRYYGYRVWAPGYVAAPYYYYAPRCYVTVYGTTVCY